MNLILLNDSDFIAPHRVRLSGRRFTHIKDVLKAECAKTLTVGKINGLMGQGTVVSKKTDAIELEVKLDQNPPEALPLTLILALPRPPALKRILFSSAQLGVKKIIILNFNRVEKSLWNSSSLKPQANTEQLVLGLEQAKDTVMPEVILKKRFKPFVEDELPALIKGKLALVAHPVSLRAQRSNLLPLSFPNKNQMSFPNVPLLDGIPPKAAIFVGNLNLYFLNQYVWFYLSYCLLSRGGGISSAHARANGRLKPCL